MSTNFRGDPLSDAQISAYALELRRYHGLGELEVPNIVALLERTSILTRFGEKQFGYQVVRDEFLDGDEAVTLVTSSHVRIRIAKTTYDRATDLDRRARMTLAHELAHGYLHKNAAPLSRAANETVRRIIPPHISVERQASVFAPAYLVTQTMIESATSAKVLADIGLISIAAADILWEKRQKTLKREIIAKGLRALSQELRADSAPSAVSTTKSHTCPVCGQFSLQEIGVKYLCTGPCNQVYDSFPDGDGPFIL